MKRIPSLLLIFIVSVLFSSLSLFTGGCAQISMPMGGPRDTLPPILLNSTPPNFSVDFNSRQIILTFDEYVQLDNPIQKVLFSPIPKKNPFVDYKLKTVTVKIYDTLKPNRTYSIQFGTSIKDLNEGNPYKDFDYVFSTGPKIDSLSISGEVKLAETGDIDSTLTITLYQELTDSMVYKEKPEYIARLDGKGHFNLKYLSPGTYYLFVLKDESGRYIYNNPEQLFAFADSAIELKAGPVHNLKLFAYAEEKPFTPPPPASKDTALKFSNTISNKIQDLLKPLTLSFNQPLAVIDTNRILLTDTLYRPIRGVHFGMDTTGKELSVDYAWRSGAEYRLIIPQGTLEDTLKRGLVKSDTLAFKGKNEEEYGSIRLNLKNLEKYEHPVLMLAQGKEPPELFPLESSSFIKKLILPGNYNISILEDRNQNGKWDPGNYAEKLQPEIVHKLTKPINIRANWDNEMDIDLDEIENMAPETPLNSRTPNLPNPIIRNLSPSPQE